MADVRVGVIGYGYWGSKLARNFATAEHCTLAAVADADPRRLDDAAADHPAARLALSAEELLARDGLDAVVIATPISTHFELAARALAGGRHVLVEKPLARSVREAETLVDLARRAGRTLMVDHTFIYSGAVRKMREIVAGGEIGEVLSVDSIRVNFGAFQADANVIEDLGPHDFSILDYVVPAAPACVSATGVSRVTMEGDVPASSAYVSTRLEGGALAHFQLSWLSPTKVRRTVICGSEKMLLYDDMDAERPLRLFDWRLELGGGPGAPRMLAERADGYEAPSIDGTEPLGRMAGHFVRCIRDGETPLTDGVAGLRVMRMLSAACDSLSAGGSAVALDR